MTTTAARSPRLGHESPLTELPMSDPAYANDAVVRAVEIPAGGAYQDSHFPEHPIFPGVFLAELCCRLALDLVDHASAVWAVTQIRALRLVAPVYPGETLEVRTVRDAQAGPARNSVDVWSTFSRDGTVVGTAYVTLEPQP